MDVLSQSWVVPVQQTDHAKYLTTKFKLLRMTLKEWQASVLQTYLSFGAFVWKKTYLSFGARVTICVRGIGRK